LDRLHVQAPGMQHGFRFYMGDINLDELQGSLIDVTSLKEQVNDANLE
jgi:hypothetical protein